MNGNKKEVGPIRRPIKALFVDDQAEDLYVPYKDIMEKVMDGEIEFISSAQEALKILEKQANNGFLPDIIVTDLGMPEMSGFELIKAIRKHQDPRINSLPFCVITGFLKESERSQLEELGIKRIFNKGLIRYNSQEIRWAWEESKKPSS